MTQSEKETLHTALFSRALKEITGGSMREAVMAVEVMERVETGKDTASEVLAALLGDVRVPDEA